MSKLKHSKIIKDNERFTEKLKDEKSRFVEDKAEVGKKKKVKLNLKEETKASEEQTKDLSESSTIVEVKTEEEYMPLVGKDFEVKATTPEERTALKETAEEGMEGTFTPDEEVKNLKKKRKGI